MFHGWEGKSSDKLATPSYSKNPRVNKDIWYDDGDIRKPYLLDSPISPIFGQKSCPISSIPPEILIDNAILDSSMAQPLRKQL